MSPAQQKGLVPWVDLTRAVAVFLVVLIHVSAQSVVAWGQIPKTEWLIANAYDSIARVSVPLFLMISGFLLLPRSESLGSLYGKRIVRILIPLVAWSLIYLPSNCATRPTGTCTPLDLWKYFSLQNSYDILWFLYVLLALYMLLPVLRPLIRQDGGRRFLFLLAAFWLFLQTASTILNPFLHLPISLNLLRAIGFLLYFVLGYFLGEVPPSRPIMVISAVTATGAVAATLVGTYLLSRADGQFNESFYGFATLNVAFASLGAFMILRWVGGARLLASQRAQAVTRSLASAAFGIYLVHLLVIQGLGFLRFNTFIGNTVWTIPTVSVVVFGISFAAVRGLQTLPLVRRIVPG